jgi:hypothetical protein
MLIYISINIFYIFKSYEEIFFVEPMAPNNMTSSDHLEGSNVRGQSQNDQPPIDIELEDEMADSMYFFIIFC